MKIILNLTDFDNLKKENRFEIRKYEEDVTALRKDWSRIEDAIITRVSSLLPFKEFTEEITVSIVDPDIEEQSENTITVDPIYTTETEAFVSKVSHEVHGLLCHNLSKYDVDAINEEDKGIVRTLETIQIEGIGDHIDIEYFIEETSHKFLNEGYKTQFKATLDNISKTFVKLDSILRKFTQNMSQSERLGEELREFTPPYGNPIGYYMTNLIIKNSFVEEMLRDIGNPFSFFKLYNKAVLKDREDIPSFSSETIVLMNKLEKKYINEEKTD